MKKITLLFLALTGAALAQSHWSASDWYRHENDHPLVESKAYYYQRSGWDEHRGSDIHYDSNGNPTVIPYAENDFPRGKLNWRDYDSNRDSRLSEDELRWMRRDEARRK